MESKQTVCCLLTTMLAMALLWHSAITSGAPVAAVPPAGALLAQAEQARTSDHARFLVLLDQLHKDETRLTPGQLWHLKYLDTFGLSFAGNYAQSRPLLQNIIDHSDDPVLAARATTRLVMNHFLNHRYQKAYVLADKLVTQLPTIDDPEARLSALSTIIQMLNSVGQYDLALEYARRIKASFPSPKGQCEGRLAETQTLLYGGKLTSASPDFQSTVDSCLAAGEVVFANALRLDLASTLVEEGQPKRAIVLLRKIAPSIHKGKYQFHVASLHVTRAEAFQRLGDDAEAHKLALAALAANKPGEVNWTVQKADKILYQLEKKAGHSSKALSWNEKYVTLKQSSVDDAKARALAYQMVKQDVLAKKMKLAALSKQNKILQLRQTVAEKASETSRLYIALLLLAVASIAFWMYRVKNSQMRFRRLAEHDGLTGAFNRQHFLDVSRQSLQHMNKVGTGACLVLMDLDYFKQVNDSHGHAAGDEVLTRTVAICQGELKSSDIFGRLGGEEFGILMPAASCEEGIAISNRIRRTLAATSIRLDSGVTVEVSASFGLACSNTSGYELPKLLRVADAALYRAKRAGRNQLAVGGSGEPGGVVSRRPRTTSPRTAD